MQHSAMKHHVLKEAAVFFFIQNLKDDGLKTGSRLVQPLYFFYDLMHLSSVDITLIIAFESL